MTSDGYIRQMYRPTKYFNSSRPDPYTYLNPWRRRMCYNTYLIYNGIKVPAAPSTCVAYNCVENYTHKKCH